MIFILIALVLAIIVYLLSIREKPIDVVEEARNRALDRQNTRAYEDTQPIEHPFDLDMNLNGIVTHEIDDRFAGHGDLSDSQKKVINAIFDGYGVGSVKEVIDSDSWRHGVFSNDNLVETIEVKNPWEKHS